MAKRILAVAAIAAALGTILALVLSSGSHPAPRPHTAVRKALSASRTTVRVRTPSRTYVVRRTPHKARKPSATCTTARLPTGGCETSAQFAAQNEGGNPYRPGSFATPASGQCPAGTTKSADGSTCFAGGPGGSYANQPIATTPTSPSAPTDCGSLGSYDSAANGGQGGCVYQLPYSGTVVAPPGLALIGYRDGGIGAAGYQNCTVLRWSNGQVTNEC